MTNEADAMRDLCRDICRKFNIDTNAPYTHKTFRYMGAVDVLWEMIGDYIRQRDERRIAAQASEPRQLCNGCSCQDSDAPLYETEDGRKLCGRCLVDAFDEKQDARKFFNDDAIDLLRQCVEECEDEGGYPQMSRAWVDAAKKLIGPPCPPSS